jgi:hypothetical protein
VQSLIRELVRRRVAVTSTLTIFETFTPGRASAPQGALDALLPEARDQYLRRRLQVATQANSPWTRLFANEMQFERDFLRAGGLLLVGTDPTGYGGVVAGYANHRALELLVEAGLTPLEAITVGTLHGARYLGRADSVGTIAVGRRADLMIVRGDPSARISDVANVETVFKGGVGFDSARLFASVRGGWAALSAARRAVSPRARGRGSAAPRRARARRARRTAPRSRRRSRTPATRAWS